MIPIPDKHRPTTHEREIFRNNDTNNPRIRWCLEFPTWFPKRNICQVPWMKICDCARGNRWNDYNWNTLWVMSEHRVYSQTNQPFLIGIMIHYNHWPFSGVHYVQFTRGYLCSQDFWLICHFSWKLSVSTSKVRPGSLWWRWVEGATSTLHRFVTEKLTPRDIEHIMNTWGWGVSHVNIYMKPLPPLHRGTHLGCSNLEYWSKQFPWWFHGAMNTSLQCGDAVLCDAVTHITSYYCIYSVGFCRYNYL